MLLPLFDPPRHDTKSTIEQCIAKGISVKMVTGARHNYTRLCTWLALLGGPQTKGLLRTARLPASG